MADKYDLDARNPAALMALLRGDLDNFFVAGTPGGIEAQEAQGQQNLVNSMQLPVEMTNRHPRDGEFWSEEWMRNWNLLESWGVRFGGYDSDADPLFVEAALPPGWKKVATSHNMWSLLVDEYGRHRAGIFYKAAFYDRKAHMHLDTRITVESDFEHEDKHGEVIVRVIADRSGVSSRKRYKTCLNLFETDPIKIGDDLPAKEALRMKHDAREAATKQATDWADEHFPNWRDSAAYWDELNVERAALEAGGLFREVQREVELYRKSHDDELPTKVYLPERLFELVMRSFGPHLSMHIPANIPPFEALEEVDPDEDISVRICTMMVERGDCVRVGV